MAWYHFNACNGMLSHRTLMCCYTALQHRKNANSDEKKQKQQQEQRHMIRDTLKRVKQRAKLTSTKCQYEMLHIKHNHNHNAVNNLYARPEPLIEHFISLKWKFANNLNVFIWHFGWFRRCCKDHSCAEIRFVSMGNWVAGPRMRNIDVGAIVANAFRIGLLHKLPSEWALIPLPYHNYSAIIVGLRAH